MAQYTIKIDDAAAETVRERARRRKVSEEQCAAQILAAHHEELRRFPDGVLREGRQKVIALLSQIPCLSRFDSTFATGGCASSLIRHHGLPGRSFTGWAGFSTRSQQR